MSGDPSAPLQEALASAVSRRLHWRGAFAVLAALGAVLLLSLLGIAAPWSPDRSPAQSGGWQPADAGPASPYLDAGPDPAAGQVRPAETRPPADAPACQPPLSVVAEPDIAGLLQTLAGDLTTGACPRVRVRGEAPSTTLANGTQPGVWVPGSSLWLRRSGWGSSTSTSVARSPVVLAVPQPVADQLASEGVWPVWIVFYDKVTSGAIPRMSMADLDTTVGALALVSFAAAADYHWGDDEGGEFLHTIHFRESLAATGADPEALLGRLAVTAPGGSASRVGVFPVTEQRLLAFNQDGPATPAVAYGTHEAMSEADYPMAVSRSLDDRLAGIAGQLRARLRSAAAVERLVAAGFRPPRGADAPSSGQFPDYPDPVPLPDRAGWQGLVDTWTWRG